ncbi:hypothetical protein ABK040_006144 [Willaertia magna]
MFKQVWDYFFTNDSNNKQDDDNWDDNIETTTNNQQPPQTTTIPQGTDKTYHVSDLLIPFPTTIKSLVKNTSTDNSDNNKQLKEEEEEEQQIEETPLHFEQDYSKLNITCEEVNGVEGCWLIHNLLTPIECQQLITISEKQMGYKPSPLSILTDQFDTSQYNEETKRIRDSQRILTDCPKEVMKIFNERIERYLPLTVDIFGNEWLLRSGTPVNERFRFNKYEVGQKFGPHFDAGYTKNRNEMTQLTIIYYLNDNFKGGETTFFPGNKRYANEEEGTMKEVKIKPKTGMASVFFQNGKLNHRHEGSPVIEGVKYIIRSDIVYVRKDKV